jgi:hypothetical protein
MHKVFEKLMAVQRDKKLSTFYATRRLITIFTTVRKWILSCAKSFNIFRVEEFAESETLRNILYRVIMLRCVADSSPPNRQSKGPPLADCLWMLIQQIRSGPPFPPPATWSRVMTYTSIFHLLVEVFGVVTMCSVVVEYHRFGGSPCLHLQGEVTGSRQ